MNKKSYNYKNPFLGIIPRAIVHMFEGKERDEDKDTIYTVHVSYVEIYNEEIRDLLNEDQAGKKLDIKGNHGVIAGSQAHRNGIIEYLEFPTFTIVSTLNFYIKAFKINIGIVYVNIHVYFHD